MHSPFQRHDVRTPTNNDQPLPTGGAPLNHQQPPQQQWHFDAGMNTPRSPAKVVRKRTNHKNRVIHQQLSMGIPGSVQSISRPQTSQTTGSNFSAPQRLDRRLNYSASELRFSESENRTTETLDLHVDNHGPPVRKSLRTEGRCSPQHPRPSVSESSVFSIERNLAEIRVNSQSPGGGGSSPFLRYPSNPPFRGSQWTEHSNNTQETTISQTFARRFNSEFTELRALGSGHFGQVLLCEEHTSRRLFAIKRSHPILSAHEEQRCQREKVALTALRECSSPHVLRLEASWVDSHQHYFQLSYCPLGDVSSVAETIRRNGDKWSEDAVLLFLGQMALALHHCHRRNIAHVDFKPENVVIDEKLNFVLADFGCAQLLDAHGRPTKTRTGVFNTRESAETTSQDEGDCRYMCHDMLNEKSDYLAGDAFALGISTFELMTNDPLPRGGSAFSELRTGSQIVISRLQGLGYSSDLCSLVASLLHADITSRPSMQSVLSNRLFHPMMNSCPFPPSAPFEAQFNVVHHESEARRVTPTLMQCEETPRESPVDLQFAATPTASHRHQPGGDDQQQQHSTARSSNSSTSNLVASMLSNAELVARLLAGSRFRIAEALTMPSVGIIGRPGDDFSPPPATHTSGPTPYRNSMLLARSPSAAFETQSQ